jgi:RHS repeat-associated protein
MHPWPSVRFDARNLLSSMTPTNGTLYTFTYDADGRRTATFFNTVSGNSTWTARTLTTYDKSGRITRITRITTALNSSPSDLVSDTSYCYSPFVSGQACPTGTSSTDKGLLQYATDNLTSKVSVYSHDKGNRLTNATSVAGHTFAYTYDSDGHRTSVKKDGTTTQSLSYTQRELISAGNNQSIWGHNDQYGQPWLQSFNTAGGSQVFVERDSSGTPLGLHIAGRDYYLVLDNQGSVVAVVDTSGNVVARYSYDPYGQTVSIDESGLSQPNIIRYTGGALDLTTGLTKLGQRYYDPALGAFTQQDASQLPANPENGNLYAYAGDNPASYIDPTGADWNQLVSYSVLGGFLTGSGEAAIAISEGAVFTTGAVVAGVILGGVFAIGFVAIACLLWC